jgi:hypothetical protein
MKKLFVLGMSSMMAVSAASAQTLEERVEALEFANYERFFNWSGQLEMRWDAVNREVKTSYNGFDGGFNSKTTNAGKDSATLGKLYAKIDFDSKPSDKLSVYGRLATGKFMSVLSSDGTRPTAGGFNDLSNGASADDKASIWLERAFANYRVTENGTFTFGRMPTIYGGPKHLQTNEPMAGNYPLVAFAGIFDGMAYTHGLGNGHTLRAVYAPFQTIEFADTIAAQYKNDEKIESKIDTWTLMYEFEKKVSFARKMHVIAQYFTFKDMPLADQELKLDLDRTSIYTEFLGLAGSKFDVVLAYMTTVTKSTNGITGVGGWMTAETDSDKVTGGSTTALVRYAISDKTKVGVLYVTNDKETFAYDAASQDPVSPYANYGTATRIFTSHDFDGGLKATLAYTQLQTDYVYKYANKIGAADEVDNKTNYLTLKLIASF